MDPSVVIEEVAGVVYLVLGLSFLFQRRFWTELIQETPGNPFFIFLPSFIGLVFGLVIVLLHNEWSLDPGLFVTLVGWIAVIKASLFLMVPEFATWILPHQNTLIKLRIPAGGTLVVLSLLVLMNVHYM